LKRSTEAVYVPNPWPNYANGKEVGLPNIGAGTIEPEHLARLKAIDGTLNVLLDTGETYLDLTSRNAQYFYLNRRPPIEVGAVYNLIHTNQQLRAIRSLSRQSVPAVLASANNIPHDGGPLGFRSHLLYRYVITHYKPVREGKYIWLVRPDRAGRLGVTETLLTERDEAQLKLLDEVFRLEDLNHLPISWGRSKSTIVNHLTPVCTINSPPLAINDLSIGGNHSYRSAGPKPFLAYSLSESGLSGRDAGIVCFDFASDRASQGTLIRLYWTTEAEPQYRAEMMVQFYAENGHVIVPLDALPRWLLGNNLRSIRIDVPGIDPSASFQLSGITIFQRRSVNELEDL
jgi:hypothetical protein